MPSFRSFFVPLALSLLGFAGCLKSRASLMEARADFETKLLRREAVGEAPDSPPAGVLDLVSYPAPLGRNAAYVSPPPGDGKKYPAVIWLFGGFSNSIGSIAWTPGAAANDQSATGFREHRILMMYPSLRGGNTNPGHIETFYGEVDDVLAAAAYLASLDYVDPARIYLGGHSTGGTLALLVAAAAPEGRFRAVFALGPVDNVTGYGAEILPFDLGDPKEGRLRSPWNWLADIKCRTFVFEGAQAPGNLDSLHALQKRSANPLIHFEVVPDGTHFSIIAPLVEKISRDILSDGIAAE